ncbi:MAG: UMP kinase [Candidatus Taylorbacteria bacterium CG11_big_fil_rev_8_21_14_0_20_46_11]|uniref:UMP kinase n=1 Tax=Candidatus Taylorbacteria bacterium CG11_big_fil_rev_8_21_14_0_20_46_11 TaxID=1975025 RepID=A0A2H0KFF7_9BACT|nr:MAG: UMP kinase [Candidatus Taylorbacteria bacterium CG11_big_fil_rev_8_21_14_0_20_46_11]
MNTSETILISVGGSIIVPDEVDSATVCEFKRIILSEVAKGKKFILMVGGGKTCRKYQTAAKEAEPTLSNNDLDWIGIHSTRFNAHFLRVVFQDYAFEDIILDPNTPVQTDKSIILAGGYRPTASTDHSAVLVAKSYGLKKLVNLSNIDYVYDSDPKKNPDAKKLEQVTWAKFREIIPDTWGPGMNAPFDPVAAREAEALGLEVAVMNGTAVENLENYLSGKPFKGTVIR